MKKSESEKVFKEIYERMKVLCSPNTSQNNINSLAMLGSEFDSYNNIMLIIAAYVARKMKMDDLAYELIR